MKKLFGSVFLSTQIQWLVGKKTTCDSGTVGFFAFEQFKNAIIGSEPLLNLNKRMLGGSISGPQHWKTSDGTCLKDL
ncbi:MAG: hypothetical protein PHO44_02910 [Sphaerochaetaceae bacterium]|nr:hypothetical protein [Sphaerochaetaceae bacterium]MDD3162652.1 hypothetical protein [Sphaerochaetaceae bacterium]MDD4006910.1 hypothetical protein [Sphaerochaetaceae bacterium]MDD4396127.1 hypothetical protein [Sphaerochaetaceae bacterium]